MASPRPSYLYLTTFIVFIILFTTIIYTLRYIIQHYYYNKYRRIYRYVKFTPSHYIIISLFTILLTTITINLLYSSNLIFLYLLPSSSLDITHSTIPIHDLPTLPINHSITIIHLSDIHYS